MHPCTHTQLTEKGRKKENMTKTEFSFQEYNKNDAKDGTNHSVLERGEEKSSVLISFIH